MQACLTALVPTTLHEWSEFYRDGGTLMHVILLIGCAGMAIAVERTWCLARWLRVDTLQLCAWVRAALLGGDTRGALRICAGRSPVERVLHAGLKACVDRRRAQQAVDEARLEVEPLLSRRLSVLGTLANVSCLVGMLGTVFGLISGFVCVASVSADARAADLNNDIALAVHTTAFGILVALLLLCARLVLVLASEKLTADLASCTAKFLDVVGVVREPPLLRASPYR